MKTKKKYKLKKLPKIVILVVAILGVLFYYGYKFYQDYAYKHSNEYYLLELGYEKEQVDKVINKLNKDEISDVLKRKYNEFIPEFVGADYFMYKNLDEYLTQVITQEQDFFKYHGTEGYDYNKIVAKVNTHSHISPYKEKGMAKKDENYAMLVNKYYELGIDYEPDDLVSIPYKYRFDGEKLIRREVLENFIKMWESAYQENIYLVISLGYRSGKKQQELYTAYEKRMGTKIADRDYSRAGFSEHQTGLALDIFSKECADTSKFKNSKSYKWLVENSYKFGFIYRYPENKKAITGYNESYHFRYVGVDLAKKVYESTLSFDEYYAYYLEK